MSVLLGLSRVIDWANAQIAANCLVLLACLISAGNAFSRYLFSESSNGWLEIQWYMFAGMVLLGAPYTLKLNEHVRVDLLYGMMSSRKGIWIDIIGGILFLLPICIILT
jgi:TRAP-type mannitol/chloroaromatic compound transport system permease small subunit